MRFRWIVATAAAMTLAAASGPAAGLADAQNAPLSDPWRA